MVAKRRKMEPTTQRQRRERREPFALVTPKGAKRTLGVTTTSDTPLHVRALGFELATGDREYARDRVRFKLGKYGMAMTRASVRFDDVSGPTGAPAIECRIKDMLRNAADVIVTWQGRTPRAALDGAIGSAERVVRRAMERGAADRAKDRRS